MSAAPDLFPFLAALFDEEEMLMEAEGFFDEMESLMAGEEDSEGESMDDEPPKAMRACYAAASSRSAACSQFTSRHECHEGGS